MIPTLTIQVYSHVFPQTCKSIIFWVKQTKIIKKTQSLVGYGHPRGSLRWGVYDQDILHSYMKFLKNKKMQTAHIHTHTLTHVYTHIHSGIRRSKVDFEF